MKICRFTHQSTGAQLRSGVIEGAEIIALPSDNLFGNDFVGLDRAPRVKLAEATLLAPCVPTKIVCVGRNYRAHAAELGHPLPAAPLLFLKPPSAVVGTDAHIELPAASHRVEHEGELAVVIGRRARRLSETDDPLAYVLGYTCANDVTARDWQRQDVQFTRAKSFDTFCPIGPFIETGIEPLDLHIETRVGGVVRQSGRTSQMAFTVPYLIRYVSHIMTLEPGDLLLTGTPAGVGPLLAGDVVEVTIAGIGTLRNEVRAVN